DGELRRAPAHPEERDPAPASGDHHLPQAGLVLLRRLPRPPRPRRHRRPRRSPDPRHAPRRTGARAARVNKTTSPPAPSPEERGYLTEGVALPSSLRRLSAAASARG